ncbi:MAG TPA: choice-of-anchor D domain-containing protein [Blastocatellia bacterium]|nr:choice-of-anchor D domain-containing protein [Blastocatellia bacterium]
MERIAMNHRPAPESAIGRILIRTFLIALILTGISIEPRHQIAEDCGVLLGCNAQPKFDIAFMLDRSGSVAQRGQTWNIMIDGVLRALRDPTVIPRDGSIAVCVVVFDGAANITVPLTDVNSAADANKVAGLVEALRCGNIQSQVFPCPFGETSWFSGIFATAVHVNQTRSVIPKPGARRVFLLVSDGATLPPDLDQASVLAEQTRNDAATVSVQLTFDAFLLGVDPQSPQFASSKAALDQIVTPKNPKGSLGTTTVIKPGPCNLQGASATGDDCRRQATELAEGTRAILRSDFPSLSLLVNTEDDTVPGAPPSEGSVSLRQAIEAANCNGGATTIGFSGPLNGKTIRPLVPLPALSAPDIVIDGCDPDQEGCVPSVTIDGGGELADGIWIRSNRDTVRGLKITNFTHAGVLIAPFCSSDNIARNLVERNVLENNPAGVVVMDQRADPRDGFNERNTISRNDMTREAPPSDPPPPALIDLGGDGPTDNDDGDADQGPNTLVNFPTSLSVAAEADGTVTITGQVSGPAVTGATVELYAITASHVLSGKVVIDGVTFLAQAGIGSCAVDATGSTCTFTAPGIAPSPTGNYTATVTDAFGNTSELMFRADGKPAAGPDASFGPTIDFGTVNLNSAVQSRPFDVTNNGNAPLQISACSVARCAPADKDDTARFSLSGCPDPTAHINPGEHVTITVAFATSVCGAAKACLVLGSNDLLHSLISSTMTGQVVSDLSPTVALEGNAASLVFGPTSAASKPKKLKKVKKQPFHTFTVDNKGCGTFNVTFASIKRVTDVPKCISSANTDDSRLWVLTQLVSGNETVITPGSTSTVPIAPGQTLTYRVRFNPAVPAVVGRACGDSKLTAGDVLPDEVSSTISILTTSAGVSNMLSVPLTGRVTKDLRLIDPNDPTRNPAPSLCRTGNDFIVQFSLYDSNQNADRAEFQFMDSAGRIVGQVITVNGLDQAIAGRNLAVGQSATIVQRFTGAADNKKVTTVQVTVFDKDGASDAALSGGVSTSCAGVAAQSAGDPATVMLPDVAPWSRREKSHAHVKPLE